MTQIMCEVSLMLSSKLSRAEMSLNSLVFDGRASNGYPAQPHVLPEWQEVPRARGAVLSYVYAPVSLGAVQRDS